MVNFKSLQSSLKHIASVGLSTAASLSILCVFLFLVHVVFQIEFYCTCSGKEQLHCWIYMISPGILISLVTLWADKRFRRIYRFTCNSCRYCWYSNTKGLSHFCCSLSLFVFKAVFAGLVWVVSLLLDGDWFACCYNSLSSDERMIPCKENNQLNLTEKMSLREQKNTSMLYGFYLICAMLVVIIGTTCRPGCKLCYSSCCCSNNYINEFKDNLLEEVETIFAGKLKTISEGYVKERINSNSKLNILKHDPDEETSGDASTSRDAHTSSGAPPTRVGASTSENAPGTSTKIRSTLRAILQCICTWTCPSTEQEPNGASQKTDLVKKVNKIDWDQFYEFSYDLIHDFEVDMKYELQKRESESREPGAGIRVEGDTAANSLITNSDTASQSRGGTLNPSGSTNDQMELNKLI